MNSPEWTTILFGCIVSAMSGVVLIAFAILLTHTIKVSDLLMRISYKKINKI
jgi:hypothetical protein